jgi:hypothetical protein
MIIIMITVMMMIIMSPDFQVGGGERAGPAISNRQWGNYQSHGA